jgi:hypothetical protein
MNIWGKTNETHKRRKQMKITKGKLRQIIKEELGKVLKEVDIDKFSDESPRLGDITTEPRYDDPNDPWESLGNKLFITHKLEGLAPEEAAERLGLGGDPDVIGYIEKIQQSDLYKGVHPDNPFERWAQEHRAKGLTPSRARLAQGDDWWSGDD